MVCKKNILQDCAEFHTGLKAELMKNKKKLTESGPLSTAGTIEFEKSKKLAHIPLIWKTYTDLTIKKRSESVSRWAKKLSTDIKDKYSDRWKHLPVFDNYVKLHDQHSHEKGIISSSEAMINFILDKGHSPFINTFVVTYNLISALTGVSIGAHDLAGIKGGARLDLVRENSPFVMIGGGQGVAHKGEYCYQDNLGVICRMDVKQCERTKITESTKEVLMFFQGHQSLGMRELLHSVELFEERIMAAGIGKL